MRDAGNLGSDVRELGRCLSGLHMLNDEALLPVAGLWIIKSLTLVSAFENSCKLCAKCKAQEACSP